MTVTRRVTEGEARRSAVQRANDNTLEVVIFGLRGLAMLCAVAALVSVLATIWTADARWAATIAVCVIVGGAAGWLGFWTFGNQGWRDENAE